VSASTSRWARARCDDRGALVFRHGKL
jgi:hypothetical protein